MTTLAWHFTADNTLRDGRALPPIGETLRHDGPVVPCESGLHASERLIDALKYAPGLHLHRVDLGGQIVPHGIPVDKLCASERTILWSLPEAVVRPIIVEWARVVAMRAVNETLPATLRAAAETTTDDVCAILHSLADRCEAAQDLTAAMAAAMDAARDARAADAAGAADAAYAAAYARDARAADAAGAAYAAYAASAVRDARTAAARAAAKNASRDAEGRRQEADLVAMVMAAKDQHE